MDQTEEKKDQAASETSQEETQAASETNSSEGEAENAEPKTGEQESGEKSEE